MNSPQNRYLVVYLLVFFLFPTIAPAGTRFSQLKHKTGGTVTGIQLDKTHFQNCWGSIIDLVDGDEITETNKTCEVETNDPRCNVCLKMPPGSEAVIVEPRVTSLARPANPANEVSRAQPVMSGPRPETVPLETVPGNKEIRLKTDAASVASKIRAQKKQKAAATEAASPHR